MGNIPLLPVLAPLGVAAILLGIWAIFTWRDRKKRGF